MFKITSGQLPHALSIRLVSRAGAVSLGSDLESEVGFSRSRLVSTQHLLEDISEWP